MEATIVLPQTLDMKNVTEPVVVVIYLSMIAISKQVRFIVAQPWFDCEVNFRIVTLPDVLKDVTKNAMILDRTNGYATFCFSPRKITFVLANND